ncbi:UDP-N-acetylmuramate:L-alanyl-gamma-D-glutamyl-meso-diaminopimelate ligase, partial [Acidithiobacillus albertensis]|nr:UDP-N-acetylmuramate:L-alanyl-gamma-D-glutamyl-meso-diaminopimelate ligase [Acidithiobacillus albertensis]
VFAPADIGWDVRAALAGTAQVSPDIDELLQQILDELQAGDQVLVMSNGAFAGIHGRLLAELARRNTVTTGEK